jgi:hypothetical protein
MFESAELGHKVDKTVYERTVPTLREALLNAQYDLGAAARFPVVIVIGGVWLQRSKNDQFRGVKVIHSRE